MREIKFRGKRKDNGEWVYGYYIKNSEGRSFIVKDIYVDEIHNPSTAKPSILCYEVIPDTVRQYIPMIRDKEEIEKAIWEVFENSELSYGYKQDVIAVLEWILGIRKHFDGIEEVRDEKN